MRHGGSEDEDEDDALPSSSWLAAAAACSNSSFNLQSSVLIPHDCIASVVGLLLSCW